MENNTQLDLDRIVFIGKKDNTVDAYLKAHDDNLLVNIATDQEKHAVDPSAISTLDKYGFDRKQIRNYFGSTLMLMILGRQPVRSFMRSSLYRHYAQKNFQFEMTYNEFCQRNKATVGELKEVCQIISNRRKHVAKKIGAQNHSDTMEKD